MSRSASLLAAWLWLLLPALLPAQEPAPLRTLEGRVLDAVSRTAVVGAEVAAVAAGRHKAWTDNTGRFRVEVPIGTDSLRIIAIGFVEARVAAADGLEIPLERLAITLPELVATGSRWTQRVAEDPAPVTIVSQAEIAVRGVTAVDQAVAGLPGVQLQPTQPQGTAVSIRGIGEQRVLVLVDGEPAPGVQLESIDLSRLSTFDAQQVEVIKGPTSSEYGSDALGGVINIVTQPPPRALTLDANVTAGNLGRFTGDAALGGTWGRVGTRLTGSVRQIDWAAGSTDANSFERVWNLGGTVRIAASPKVELRADARYFYERQRWPVNALFNGFQDNQGLSGWAEGAFSAAGGRMRLRAFGQAFDYKYRAAEGDIPQAGNGRQQSEDIVRGLFAYDRRLGPHTLGLGAQFSHREIVSPDRVEGGGAVDDQWELWAKDQARYGRFTYTAGARYTSNNRWGDNLAPSLGAVWEPSTAWRVRGNVARGFRAPTFKETGWQFGNPAFGYTIVGNPDLVAESSWAFSGGTSWLAPLGIVLDVDIYRNDVRNLIDFFAGSDENGTVFTPENIASARTQGVELAARYSARGWSAQVGYNYLDARNLTDDLPLNRRSTHTGRARVTRVWERFAGLRVDFTGTYTGPAEIVETGIDAGGTPTVTGEQTAFLSLDLRAGVMVMHQLELSIGVDNLLDAQPEGWVGPIQRRVYLGLRSQWLPLGGAVPERE
ncbi:MAG: TonB-dependent receptor [Gemmatimonadales bacterium]|nr:TonB-dependent receptor [Gemmatimonadales bacterium]